MRRIFRALCTKLASDQAISECKENIGKIYGGTPEFKFVDLAQMIGVCPEDAPRDLRFDNPGSLYLG